MTNKQELKLSQIYCDLRKLQDLILSVSDGSSVNNEMRRLSKKSVAGIAKLLEE